MSMDRNISANFFLNSHNLNLVAGLGGTVSGSGSFDYGTTKSITATPDTGYSFAGWSGDGVTDPSSSSTTVSCRGTVTFRLTFS